MADSSRAQGGPGQASEARGLPADTASGARSGAGQRIIFLDVARCLAIVLMVVAHFADSFLSPVAAAAPLGQAYARIRGVTAPLFFGVSGWAFIAATLPRWDAYRRLGPELKARLRRAGVLFLWGYLLVFPWWAPGFPFSTSAEVWGPFFSFGVLHCVGASLVIGHLLLRATPGPRAFAAVALPLSVVLVAGAPYFQWAGSLLPRAIGGALFAGSFTGGFPLAPWSAYFLLGAGIGALAITGRWSTRRIALGAAILAVASLCLGLALEPHALRLIPGELARSSPHLFLRRLGMACVVMTAIALLAPRIRELPGWMRLTARHALTFYVAHMIIIWGLPFLGGLVHRIPKELSLLESVVLALTCVGAIFAGVRLVHLARGSLRRTGERERGAELTSPAPPAR